MGVAHVAGGEPGRPQFQRFLDAGHAERIGLGLQRAGAAHRTVPVGIGLDHRNGLAAPQFACQPVIAAQRVQVNQRTGWAHELDSR